MTTAGVIPNPQFVPVPFPVLDSTEFDAMDPQAIKLYLKMRRFIWRKSTGELGDWFSRGWLVLDGNLNQWGTWLGVSKSTVSRKLNALHDARWALWLFRSQATTDRNVVALGTWVPAGEVRVEVYFLDTIVSGQLGRLLQELPEIPAQQSHCCTGATVPFHQRNGTVAPVQRTNRESSNNEEKEEASGDSVLAVVAQLFEREIGSLTAMVYDELAMFTEEHRDPQMWVQVFRASVGKTNRWAWIRRVMENGGYEPNRREANGNRRNGGRMHGKEPTVTDSEVERINREAARRLAGES